MPYILSIDFQAEQNVEPTSATPAAHPLVGTEAKASAKQSSMQGTDCPCPATWAKIKKRHVVWRLKGNSCIQQVRAQNDIDVT